MIGIEPIENGAIDKDVDYPDLRRLCVKYMTLENYEYLDFIPLFIIMFRKKELRHKWL